MENYPRDWCAACMGYTTRTYAQANLKPERIVLPVQCPPETPRYDWNPTVADVSSIPKETEWIHVCGWTSQPKIEDLIDRCQSLRLIEVPPSIESLFDRDLLDLLDAYHIGLHLLRIKYRATA